MSDFIPKLIAHSEIIGDSNSSEYYSDYNALSLTDRNTPTNIASKTVMQVLEFILTIVLMPLSACQKMYKNDHLMIMLRVIVEVILELIMWLVLAGVSILTSAVLIFDDLYSGKSGSDSYRRLVKNYTEETALRQDELPPHNSSTVNGNNISNIMSSDAENEWIEEIVAKSNRDNRDRVSSSFLENEVYASANKNFKTISEPPENDDESPNFSFYKPLRYNPIVESNRKHKR